LEDNMTTAGRDRFRYQAWYRRDMWAVDYLPEAARELAKLPGKERKAIDNAVRKLQALGPDLPAPHSSDVRGAPGLRELRPRGGHCPWRPLFRRTAGGFVIAAIAPDGKTEPRRFAQACEQALRRLSEMDTGK
jgi:hypothetical protein